MPQNLKQIFGEAIAHLKKADVVGATALIRRSLGFGQLTKQPPRTKPVSESTREASSRNRPEHSSSGPSIIYMTPPNLPPRQPSRKPSTALERGIGFTSRTFHSNAGSLSYKLYVPAEADADDLALVLMLHGCTQDPDDFARGTDMNRLADELGFIVVYPHQPRMANPQGCWNWFDDRHQHRGSGEPVLLAGLAQELAREFEIGGDRIFAAGLSAGGAMADILAETYPEVFAAVGIHSGLPYGAAKNMMSAFAAMKGTVAPKKSSTPAQNPRVRKIIFHGDADTTVNISNGATILNRAQSGQPDVTELTNDVKVNGRAVTRTVLDNRDGETLAEYWVIHGAPHGWAGGKRGGSYVDTSGPDASREMLRFFLRR